jgi:hypothetical protein
MEVAEVGDRATKRSTSEVKRTSVADPEFEFVSMEGV